MKSRKCALAKELAVAFGGCTANARHVVPNQLTDTVLLPQGSMLGVPFVAFTKPLKQAGFDVSKIWCFGNDQQSRLFRLHYGLGCCGWFQLRRVGRCQYR